MSELISTPEEVAPIVNITGLLDLPVMYRYHFSSERLYFKEPINDEYTKFYTGITGAIKKSGLTDTETLNRIRLDMALNGVDASDIWDEKRDYGTLFHEVVSNHERTDDKRIVFKFNSSEILSYAKKTAEKYGHIQMYPIWISRLNNDMAAWFKFKKDYDVKVIGSECCVYHDVYKICTPLDILCTMKFNKKKIFANINLKTGTHSREGRDYTLQVALEAYIWNKYFEERNLKRFILSGSFLWRPKDRDRSPCQYNLSKNHISSHTEEEFNHIGNGVNLNKLNQPKGLITIYDGDEEEFIVKQLTPNEYVTDFFNRRKLRVESCAKVDD